MASHWCWLPSRGFFRQHEKGTTRPRCGDDALPPLAAVAGGERRAADSGCLAASIGPIESTAM